MFILKLKGLLLENIRICLKTPKNRNYSLFKNIPKSLLHPFLLGECFLVNGAGMSLERTGGAELLLAVVAGEVFRLLVHVQHDLVWEHLVAVVAKRVQVLVFALYSTH